jgi:glycosyltransferase involved in cell wall biosynthesis
MKIAQVAPLAECVPPRLYGGSERIVSYLTEELVRKGHDVTLFASSDSLTSARLIGCAPAALRLTPSVVDALPWHLVMLERVRRRAGEFDVLHFHIDLLQFPLLRSLGTPALTTLHGRQDLPDLQPFYRTFPDAPLVSISDHQRRPLPTVNWMATVHHGLPRDLYSFQPNSAGYLLFLGRISPEKRPDRAIEIATRAGMPLKIAAKIDKVDEEYWRAKIQPLVRGNDLIDFVGEVGDADKNALIGGASAVLFPIDWPEPFGLVMIEAMACGTPVIAFRCGSVPEVLEDGVTGFIVGSTAEAAAAVGRLDELDRATVRATFERRFEISRVADDYLAIYHALCRAAQTPEKDVLPLSA